MLLRSLTAVVLLVSATGLLEGCGGGGASSGQALIAQPPRGTQTEFSTVVLTIKSAGASSVNRRPLYVSPGTKSLKITVTPTSGPSSTVTSNCAASCSATLQAAVGVDRFNIGLYDASDATGNLLSSAIATATIAAGQSNAVSVSFGGAIARLALVIDSSSLQAGVAGSVPLGVVAYDADGYQIVGTTPYTSSVTLTLADPTGATSLSTTSLITPGAAATLTYNGAAAGATATIGAASNGVPPVSKTLQISTSSGSAPLHIPNLAYYQGANKNTRISASWFGQHYAMTQQGSGADYARAFLAAGGKYAMAYSDPTMVAGCTWPAPYDCGAPLGSASGLRNESSWLHDSNGQRLHVVSGGTMPDGYWQERLNPGDPAVRAAYAAQTGATGGNAIFADDTSASIDPTPPGTLDYDMYKYGAIPYEYCKGTTAQCEVPSQQFVADFGAMLSSSAHPVFMNGGTLSDNLAVMQANPNIIGNGVENCYTPTISDATWQVNQDFILRATALHKYSLCFPKHRSNQTAERAFYLASYWMVYDGTYAVLWEDFPMSNGDQGIMPEYGVVPGTATVNPTQMSDLRKATGVYVREFTGCAQNGVVFGRCAAIVNNTTSSVALPALGATYSQTMGFGSTTSWYDGGTAQWTSGAPTTIAPQSGIILR